MPPWFNGKWDKWSGTADPKLDPFFLDMEPGKSLREPPHFWSSVHCTRWRTPGFLSAMMLNYSLGVRLKYLVLI